MRIVHIDPNYPEKIIFWCFGNPERLIQQINNLGVSQGGSLGF